jgi:hypothetical protein
MKVRRNPFSFIMNACLFFHPTLELSLGTKPMYPIN